MIDNPNVTARAPEAPACAAFQDETLQGEADQGHRWRDGAKAQERMDAN